MAERDLCGIVAAVKRWQADSRLHPLTCGVDSQGHALLEPEIRNGEVVLHCPTCGFVQTYIPNVVVTALDDKGEGRDG